jgi:hypothetical protein
MAPQFDRPLRDLLRAAGCTFVRAKAATKSVQPDHQTKFPGADRNPEPPHGQCDFAAGRIAEGVLIRLVRQRYVEEAGNGATSWRITLH